MYNNSFYKVIDKFINRLRLNGFKQITYGNENELDLTKRQSDYPLAHIVVPTGFNDAKKTTMTFMIVVADKVDKTDNKEYPEYGQDNTIDIQQDLLVRIQTTLASMDRRYLETTDSIAIGYEIDYTTNFESFKEDYPELLTGFIFSINISFPNMIDDLECEDYGIEGVPTRPQNYSTSGTSGTSGIDGTSGTSGIDGIAYNNSVPSSSSASGTEGDMAYDANYLYVCWSDNNWFRISGSTF